MMKLLDELDEELLAVLAPVVELLLPFDELEELEDEPTASPTAAFTVAIVPAVGAVRVVLSREV